MLKLADDFLKENMKPATIMQRNCNDNDLANGKMLKPDNYFDKCVDPLEFFRCSTNHSIVILNRDINIKPKILLQLWQTAKVRITVDGGTDKWLEYVYKKRGCTLENMNDLCLPDLVTGDFDSILPETLKRCKSKGIKVVNTDDQMETDYTKALRQLKEHCNRNNITLDYIFVVSDTAGRFDHTIANINTLYKCRKFLHHDIQVIHISDDTLTWLIPKGKQWIRIPDVLLDENWWCSLIPFGSNDNCITTTGLKWNLNKQSLKFGELVSTSNSYSKNEVTVETNYPIVWSMGVESFLMQVESEIAQNSR